MAGSSKHYVWRSGDGERVYLDYQIPQKLWVNLSEYLMMEGLGLVEVRERKAQLDATKGWRNQLKLFLSWRTARFRRNFPIKEYVVYPHRKPDGCTFRQYARSYRKFMHKPTKTPVFIPPARRVIPAQQAAPIPRRWAFLDAEPAMEPANVPNNQR